jgi:hypothetical protein
MQAVTVGNGNTAYGNLALGSILSGDYNTAVGSNAGYGVFTTIENINYCTFLGYRALPASDGVTNSTALGNSAQVTVSNQIVIGNTAVTQTILRSPVADTLTSSTGKNLVKADNVGSDVSVGNIAGPTTIYGKGLYLTSAGSYSYPFNLSNFSEMNCDDTPFNNVGSMNVNGAVSLLSAVYMKTETVSSSPYTVAASNHYIYVDATSAGITVQLPAATGTGRVLVLKKVDSSGNAVVYKAASGETIDGSAAVTTSTPFASMSVQDGASTKWWVH